MVILLDIDGVMVTTPAWRAVELQADGFMRFNERAAKHLASIVDETHAAIVLTTTHRISYSIEEWELLLKNRGINPTAISKINDIKALETMADRATEIEEWVANSSDGQNYVIIDDDLSINRLSRDIKKRVVLTKPMIGLDAVATTKALNILRGKFE